MNPVTKILSMAAALAVMVRMSGAESKAQAFLAHCASESRILCTSYECFARSLQADLRQMESLECHSNKDCMMASSGMVCVAYDQGKRFCECPRNYAFNVSSCQCEQAHRCPLLSDPEDAAPSAVERVSKDIRGNSVQCHNGLECADSKCSCSDLRSTLYEATGRFCVLPRAPGSYWFDTVPEESNPFMTVIIVIAVCVCVVFITVGGYILSEEFTCNKGDYKCDEQRDNDLRDNGSAPSPDDSGSGSALDPASRHIAAWDLPSLDYLSEEQTMKYLRKHELDAINHHSNHGGGSEETSVVGAGSDSPSGSLPECDSSNGRFDRVNRGFVEDISHVTMDVPKEV